MNVTFCVSGPTRKHNTSDTPENLGNTDSLDFSQGVTRCSRSGDHHAFFAHVRQTSSCHVEHRGTSVSDKCNTLSQRRQCGSTNNVMNVRDLDRDVSSVCVNLKFTISSNEFNQLSSSHTMKRDVNSNRHIKKTATQYTTK